MISSKGPGGEEVTEAQKPENVTWRKVKPLRMSHGKRLRHWDSHFLNQRGGRYTPGFSPLFSLWSLVGTSHSPNPSEVSWHRAGEAQPAGTSISLQHIQGYSVKHECIWMQMVIRNNICKSAHILSQSVKCFLISICSPLSVPHFSSQTTRNRENGYYISKVFWMIQIVFVALPAFTSHPPYLEALFYLHIKIQNLSNGVLKCDNI